MLAPKNAGGTTAIGSTTQSHPNETVDLEKGGQSSLSKSSEVPSSPGYGTISPHHAVQSLTNTPAERRSFWQMAKDNPKAVMYGVITLGVGIAAPLLVGIGGYLVADGLETAMGDNNQYDPVMGKILGGSVIAGLGGSSAAVLFPASLGATLNS